jgi:hypothetical protein
MIENSLHGIAIRDLYYSEAVTVFKRWSNSPAAGVFAGLGIWLAAFVLCFNIGGFLLVTHESSVASATVGRVVNFVFFLPTILLVGSAVFFLRKERSPFITGLLAAIAFGILLSSACGLLFLTK